MKSVPFIITCPEIRPGQGVRTKEITVEVQEEDGCEVLTVEAMERIEKLKMQMMLTRITQCLVEIYAAIGVLPSRDPKATENVTAQGCNLSPSYICAVAIAMHEGKPGPRPKWLRLEEVEAWIEKHPDFRVRHVTSARAKRVFANSPASPLAETADKLCESRG
jgi:hypothetical protein